mmetsp:Transcript_33398/g.131707  ORF Transcript_33398/g.131707 Transcript_33398/m.131707 type:complete len:444 (-) Transcript_33398:1930-3261(-)
MSSEDVPSLSDLDPERIPFLQQSIPSDYTDEESGEFTRKRQLSWAGDPVQEDRAHGPVLDLAMNLAACAFGASMLSLPFVLDISGALVGMFMIVGLALMAVLASSSIMHAGFRFKKSSYTKIVAEAFGKKASVVAEVLLCACLFVAAVSYVVGLADLLPDMIGFTSGMPRTLRIFFIYAGLWPITWVGSLSAFGPSSMFACVGCYVQAVALVTAAIFSDIDVPGPELLFKFNPAGIALSLPMVTFTHAYHYVLTDTFLELKNPSKVRLMSTVWTTGVTLTTCYLIVAIIGYLLYGGRNVPSNVLTGLGNGSPVIGIATWSIGLLLFATYSLFIIPLRRRLEEILFGRQTRKLNGDRILAAAVIGALVIIASILLRDLYLANTVAGGCIAIVTFVIPGLFDVYCWKMFKVDRNLVTIARGVLLLCAGTTAGFIGLFGSLLPLKA